jgi:hypothetical protein
VLDLEFLCVCHWHVRIVMISEAPLCGASEAVAGMIFCENEHFLCYFCILYNLLCE